ncbi:TetR/AcrR family transcriptional regulator [Thermovibrio sp.]
METREKILQAAYKCFSEKGFLGATTKEIAREAGVSEITLFRHFKSKRELFEEVLNRFSVIRDIERISSKGKGRREALKEIGVEILNSLKEKRSFLKILLSEVISKEPEVEKVYRKFIKKLDALIAEVLGSDKVKARLFHSTLFGLFISKELFLKEELSEKEKKEVVEKLVETFLREKDEGS